MRRAVPFALAVVVVLSGCSALGGLDPGSLGQSTDTTSTPTPGATQSPTAHQPTEPTSTPDSTPEPPEALAPGVTEAGVENLSALLDAHESALLAGGFGTRFVAERDSDAESNRSVTSVASGPDGVPALVIVDRTHGERVEHVERWANGTVLYTRTAGGPVTIERSEGRLDERTLALPGRVRAILSEAVDSFEVSHVQSANGTEVVTLEATVRSDEDQREANVTAVVTGTGQIARVEASDRIGETRTRTTTFSVTKVGGDGPESPAWVDNRRREERIDASVRVRVADDTFVRVVNDGPDTIPENASVRVTSADLDETVSLARAVQPGDTNWVYIQLSELRVTNARSSSGKLNKLPKTFRLVIATPTGVEVVNETLER